MSDQLQRLVIDFRDEVLVVRALYDHATPDAPAPNTKARTREVAALVRAGLERALASLEGDTEMVGTSGFTRREDILTTTSPVAAKRVKKGAA